MLHAAQSHTVASMADAALGYAGVKDVSLAFALELPPDQLVSIFTAFTDATEDPLLAGLQLAALSASEGYFRSAWQMLTCCSADPLRPTRLSNELLGLANTILAGTHSLGAARINNNILRTVAGLCPELADRLPSSPDEQTRLYGLPLDLGTGALVNQLRGARASQLISSVKERRAEVLDDLFNDKVYAWIVTFLQQSEQYDILSKDEFGAALSRLDDALVAIQSRICLWHRDAVLPSRATF